MDEALQRLVMSMLQRMEGVLTQEELCLVIEWVECFYNDGANSEEVALRYAPEPRVLH